jgi:hypothetical protein
MIIVSLPVIVALSWVPVAATPATPPMNSCATKTTQQPAAPQPAANTITCPLTGDQIPACCCPVASDK